ncbi:MAG: aspartate carbamoyltransferase regulatory subunit [Burkholderiales bacterium]|nr:aspartate carbamoyltransferase regulatory subunit [Burkholderiales bacterium]
MENKIGALANGVNIDHIPQGNAWHIIKLLKLQRKYPVGIGLNLTSKRLGVKDLVKIENYKLSEEQLSAISIFAPGATYSEIENYQIVKKVKLTVATEIENLVICPNHRCVSHQYRSKFSFNNEREKVVATCHYCEHNYELSSLTEFNL